MFRASGFRKARQYLLGCFTLPLIIDYSPLVKLFRDRGMNDIINPRLVMLDGSALQMCSARKFGSGHLYALPVAWSAPDDGDMEHGEELMLALLLVATRIAKGEYTIIMNQNTTAKATAVGPDRHLHPDWVRNGV